VPSSRSVFLHVGLPKTGTTFLQRVLGERRDAVKAQGLLYPGSRNDHFFEAQDLLKRPFRGQDDDRVPGSWQALVDEVSSWPGACLVSHELFTVATSEQVREVVGAFPDRSVEVVVTARDLARQLTASWQETVKNGQTPTLAEYVGQARTRDGNDRGDESSSGFWYWQDLPGVLTRWLEVVPAERVHLVTVPPPGAESGLLLQRFADVLGLRLSVDELTGRSDNASLGVVETEFIRRLNVDLDDSLEWADYRTYVKQFLAQRALPRFEQSGPIALSPTDQSWAADRSRELAGTVSTLPVRVHGDLSDLESPAQAEAPDAVSDEAVAEVGVRAIAQMLRRIGREQGAGASAGRTS
jgi:hypothetical protein